MHLPLLLALITVASSDQEILFGTEEPVNSGTDATYCSKVPLKCEESKYQSYDGSCNNLEHSWWGTPYTPYWRFLCNTNSNEVQPINDVNLPNPRSLSQRLFVDLDVEDKLWSLLFMQYGQIIAHDMSLTAGVVQTKKDALSCCSADGKPTPEAETNPRCAPIAIPKDDSYNALQGKTCMNFIRVETTKDGRNCTNATDVPEPLTSVTAFLDVSYLYGSDEDTAKKVRKWKGGQLASVERNGKRFLPQDPDPEQACNVDSHTEPCYFAGDVRVNQNPQLALLHNLYMEHHNMIAHHLALVNPHWKDETLFQETRRIVIAIHQWIIYHEFLTGLLGEEYMIKNKLYYPNETGYINDYDPSVNPGVSSEFAACAFRLFHSEIVGSIRSVKENRNTSHVIKLSDWYNKPSVCEHADNFNGLLRGLATQPQSAVDRFISEDVLNLLFKTDLLGQDLKAIDMQRGRDQGVCPCAKALRALNLSDPQSFQDFEKFMKPEKVAVLENLYKTHEDVDLCTCIFLEERMPGSLIGPMAQRILGEQFWRTRVGDRHFFENGNGKYPFTIDQLNEIRKTTISGILCSIRSIKKMQAEAFKLISEKNLLLLCESIPKFNTVLWKEKIINKN